MKGLFSILSVLKNVFTFISFLSELLKKNKWKKAGKSEAISESNANAIDEIKKANTAKSSAVIDFDKHGLRETDENLRD